MQEAKFQLRVELRKRLLGISAEQQVEKSRKACQNLISTPQFKRASTIMMYMPLPHEADASDAILSAWQQNKTVAVPKVSWQQRHMLPVQISTLEKDFSSEAGGLQNPVKGNPVPFEEIDLVITPGLGFDSEGNRIGRGGSFYDNFFVHRGLRASRCGFAFAEQFVDSIPVSSTDVPMDFLVTDEAIVYFNQQQGG